MSTPLDLATSITGSATGMEGTSVNTMTNYTYTFVPVRLDPSDTGPGGAPAAGATSPKRTR